MSDYKAIAYKDKFNDQIYCLDCTADLLNDDTLRDPYQVDELEGFPAIFEDDLDEYAEYGLECDYCYTVIDEGE